MTRRPSTDSGPSPSAGTKPEGTPATPEPDDSPQPEPAATAELCPECFPGGWPTVAPEGLNVSSVGCAHGMWIRRGEV